MKPCSALLWIGAAFCAACGGSQTESKAVDTAENPLKDIVADDRGRCDFKGRTDREVVESRGPGTFVPNVRRVFGVLGEGDDRRRILLCREIDTNLDGVKDVVRTYNDKSEALEEQADSNYDGKIDTWIRFASGRISKVELDKNFDGRPDETRYYVKGRLSRVQRDTNANGKVDTWEIYADGRLERMGVDVDHDGHVDRWDRDEIALRAAEIKARQEEEKKAREEARQKAKEAADNAAAERGSEAAGSHGGGNTQAGDGSKVGADSDSAE